MSYELVAGLETHIELSTQTKMFCRCTTLFGREPNTQCCPVCLGLPGALPLPNKKAIHLAVIAGLATNCEISSHSGMDRKNYFYPDMPKSYQITQHDVPICRNGYIELSNGKRIRIQRIHIEEDAGKLLHGNNKSFIDYNRAGVPLIEVVTEPDISSAEEAREYVERLRDIMRTLGVSDCKMQEGSLRCDVNLSVRRKGFTEIGARTEIKNINSISNMMKAMDCEFKRHVEILEKGLDVIQQTMRYDEVNNVTVPMRNKESASDYRFFPEPNIHTIKISDADILKIKAHIPILPFDREKKYREVLGLSQKDAYLLSKYRRVAEFFDDAVVGVRRVSIVANFMLGQVFSRFQNEDLKEKFEIKITPVQLNELALLVDNGKISNNLAKITLETMLDTGRSVREVLSKDDMSSIRENELECICKRIIDSNSTAVRDFNSGKKNALKFLTGCVMKETKGRADAIKTEQIILGLIN